MTYYHFSTQKIFSVPSFTMLCFRVEKPHYAVHENSRQGKTYTTSTLIHLIISEQFGSAHQGQDSGSLVAITQS